jgi:hypothetical protein
MNVKLTVAYKQNDPAAGDSGIWQGVMISFRRKNDDAWEAGIKFTAAKR